MQQRKKQAGWQAVDVVSAPEAVAVPPAKAAAASVAAASTVFVKDKMLPGRHRTERPPPPSVVKVRNSGAPVACNRFLRFFILSGRFELN